MRKQAFLVPVVLNLIIVAGLCWRVYYAVPLYLEQLITIMGYDTRFTVNTKTTGWEELLKTLGYRTMFLSIDYALFGLLGRWPWEFVLGDKYGRYTGPCGWKWNVGFSRQKEPVVRRGRKWDAPIYQSEMERRLQGKPDTTWTKEEELAAFTKCSDALSKHNTAKNALSLLDKDWDLDYSAMVDVTELIDVAKLSHADVDHVVLVPWHQKWYSWYPHKPANADGSISAMTGKDEKLELFKKNLIDLNAEDVFYRFVELLQYESSQTGGFTKAKKKEAEEELRKMLRARNKDDVAFFASIGGTGGIPGLAPET